jgi:hypothetical protein
MVSQHKSLFLVFFLDIKLANGQNNFVFSRFHPGRTPADNHSRDSFPRFGENPDGSRLAVTAFSNDSSCYHLYSELFFCNYPDCMHQTRNISQQGQYNIDPEMKPQSNLKKHTHRRNDQ